MRFLIFIMMLGMTQNSFSWGKLGHRITGEIAQAYLSGKAESAIKELVGNESLARMSNYADFIKSDAKLRRKYNHYHYISVDGDQTVAKFLTKKQKKDNVVTGIKKFEKTLRSKKSSQEEKIFALKMLVHLVGDIHQPLHVGKSEDKGGNTISVKWFGKRTNLHAVWDESLIQMQRLSYTEFAKELISVSDVNTKELQVSDVIVWAQESKDYVPKVYDFKQQKYWEYNYNYIHKKFLEERLLKGGIRLAGLLNSIFK